MAPEQWREGVRDFRHVYVVKFPKLFQALYYFLQFKPREYICERDTNKLDWKKAKSFLNEEMFTKMGDFWPIGPKETAYKEYEKMKFVSSSIAGINEEDIDEYSIALGKLYRWLKLAIEVRIEDVRMRRNNKKASKEKREALIE